MIIIGAILTLDQVDCNTSKLFINPPSQLTDTKFEDLFAHCTRIYSKLHYSTEKKRSAIYLGYLLPRRRDIIPPFDLVPVVPAIIE